MSMFFQANRQPPKVPNFNVIKIIVVHATRRLIFSEKTEKESHLLHLIVLMFVYHRVNLLLSDVVTSYRLLYITNPNMFRCICSGSFEV